MRRVATLLFISFAVCASDSYVVDANDDPPFTALASSSYSITIECVDGSGNTSQREVTVSVPKPG